jgi:glycosyltransferase involved in cell wall biosynthesis
MKVLFVAREYPPFEVGGVARHTFNLVGHLRKLGVECEVVSFGDPLQSNDGVRFIRPRSSIISRGRQPAYLDLQVPFDIVRFTSMVNRLIEREGFDVVHVEEPYVGSFVTHGRKVTTIHDTSYGELRSILNAPSGLTDFRRAIFYIYLGFLFEKESGRNSRAIIVPSAQVKSELVVKYGFDAGRIRVIRNGVILPPPSSLTREEAKRRLGLPNVPLVFSASQHVARKRLETLIEAAKLLREHNIILRVAIAGDGPLRPNLISLSESYGLNGFVSFPGWVPQEELDLYYRAADIFVITSEYEAGPIAMLEAMASGATVVSTKIGGFAACIRDGVDGLVYPVGDSGALSSSLERALRDQDFLQKSSSLGRAFAERFDWGRVAEDTLSLYEEIA